MARPPIRPEERETLRTPRAGHRSEPRLDQDAADDAMVETTTIGWDSTVPAGGNPHFQLAGHLFVCPPAQQWFGRQATFVPTALIGVSELQMTIFPFLVSVLAALSVTIPAKAIDLDELSVLTLTRDGSWGAATAGSQGAAIAPVLVQTPEEAVAFFMWGLEDGSRSSQLAANKWAIEDADGRTSAFEIKRVSECRYDVHMQKQLDSDSLWFDYALDFSSVTEYDAWIANSSGKAIIIKIEGIRWYSKKVVNLKNGRVLQLIKDGSVDANVAAGGSVERLRRAYADFRTNHCRGRGHSLGEVVAVDAPNGTVTVRHTRIEQAGLNVPEGTHRFRARSDLLGGHIFNAVRPGDEIKFSAARVDGELVFIEVDKPR